KVSTTRRLVSLGANIIGAPKSEKLTVKTNNKLERIPGIASGSVIKINVNQFFAPRFLDPSSKVISLTRKVATIGHRAYGKKKKTWTIAMPSREYGSISIPSPPSIL